MNQNQSHREDTKGQHNGVQFVVGDHDARTGGGADGFQFMFTRPSEFSPRVQVVTRRH